MKQKNKLSKCFDTQTMFLILVFSIHANLAFGVCRFENNSSINFRSSYQKSTQHFFDKHGITSDKHSVLMPRCEEEAGKYFMLGVGAKYMSRNHFSGYTSYFKAPDVKECTFDSTQNSFQVQKPEEVQDLILEQMKTIEKCLVFKVTEKGTQKLSYQSNQQHCQITKIDDKSVFVKGGLCFLKHHLDSRFEVEVSGDPNCTRREYLENEKINPKNMKVDVGYYFSGDDQGTSAYLNNIGATEIDVNIEGDESLFSLSDAWTSTTPAIPDYFVFPNVQISEINIEKSDFGTRLEVPWIIDQRCKKTCDRGLCSSPCDYNSPVVGYLNLYQKNKNTDHWQHIDHWYQGSMFYPRWQGILDGFGASHEVAGGNAFFHIGERYRLTIEFNDPRYYWEMYIDQIKRRINNIALSIPGLEPSENTIPELPNLPTLDEAGWNHGEILLGVIPELNVLDLLGSGLSNEPLVDLHRLVKLIKFQTFPPYYRKICDQNLENCFDPTVGVFAKYSVEFDVVDFEEGNEPFPTNFGDLPTVKRGIIGNVTFQRETKFDEDKTFNYESNQFIEVQCRY